MNFSARSRRILAVREEKIKKFVDPAERGPTQIWLKVIKFQMLKMKIHEISMRRAFNSNSYLFPWALILEKAFGDSKMSFPKSSTFYHFQVVSIKFQMLTMKLHDISMRRAMSEYSSLFPGTLIREDRFWWSKILTDFVGFFDIKSNHMVKFISYLTLHVRSLCK